MSDMEIQMYSTYCLFLYWEYCLNFQFLYFQAETENLVFECTECVKKPGGLTCFRIRPASDAWTQELPKTQMGVLVDASFIPLKTFTLKLPIRNLLYQRLSFCTQSSQCVETSCVLYHGQKNIKILMNGFYECMRCVSVLLILPCYL